MCQFPVVRLILAAPFGLLALSACGAGGGGSEIPVSAGDPAPKPVIEPGDLPVSGNASYDGLMTLRLPQNGDALSAHTDHTGNLRLNVDFDVGFNQVTGVVDGFQTPTNEPMVGRVFVTEGLIDRGASSSKDYTFDAKLSGTLSALNFSSTVISGTVLGDFSGSDLSALTGRVYGNLVLGNGVDIFDGTYATVRSD